MEYELREENYPLWSSQICKNCGYPQGEHFFNGSRCGFIGRFVTSGSLDRAHFEEWQHFEALWSLREAFCGLP